jgi:hypothetical protein
VGFLHPFSRTSLEEEEPLMVVLECTMAEKYNAWKG